MTRDVLDLFNGVEPSDKPAKDYPGTTPPKNRGKNVARALASMPLLDQLPYRTYLVAGEPMQCYSVGSLSKLLNRDVVTIRSWERKGWMPMPRIRTAPPNAPQLPGKPLKGHRLYTREQVEYIVRAYESSHLYETKDKWDWDNFRLLMTQYPKT